MEIFRHEAESTANRFQVIEHLLEEYGTEIKRIAFLYVKDYAATEDILQEVFISCYQHLESFRHESSYKTWLIKITINKCKDHLKRWSFRNLIYRDKMDFRLIERSTPEEELLLKQRELLLVEHVLSLPIKLREIIILYYYEELSVEEIGSLLDLKVNTVKSRLHRARANLKEQLKGWEDEWLTD